MRCLSLQEEVELRGLAAGILTECIPLMNLSALQKSEIAERLVKVQYQDSEEVAGLLQALRM
jgi:hypothetical protein